MSCWRIGFLLATYVAATIEAEIIHEVDWVTLERANKPIEITGPPESSEYESAFGFFRHWSSGKYIHIYGNRACPDVNSKLVIHSGYHTGGSMSFKFVQVIGHYGYMTQTCGNSVHPDGGSLHPADQTPLIIHSGGHAGTLFTFDEGRMLFMHASGSVAHPYGGRPNPEDQTEVVLHSNQHNAAKFEFVNPSTLQPQSIFPSPYLFGTWRNIFAVINPLVPHEYRVEYRIGKSVTKQASSELEWTVSSGVAFKWFEASQEFRRFAQMSESTTWEVEITKELTISVPAGETVVVWQYFFDAEQFGDGYSFRSTIIGNTDDVDTPPDI